jgi:hypothetical protein
MPEEPSEEEVKEVYARFGLAYYFSEVLHRALCNAYVLAPFEKEDEMSSMRVDERFDFAWSTTLGRIINHTDGTILSEDVIDRLDDALERRNYLAHYFWFERIPKINSRSGVEEMIGELDEAIEMFRSLNEEISAQLKNHAEKVGITEQVLDQAKEEVLSGEEMRPLHDQRKLERQERVVSAYKVPVQDSKVIILETKDGELWQLSDAGLAWTPYEEPGEDWVKDERLMPYLPATIDPRPGASSPFNYSLHLSGGILRVAKQDGHVVWTVDTKE